MLRSITHMYFVPLANVLWKTVPCWTVKIIYCTLCFYFCVFLWISSSTVNIVVKILYLKNVDTFNVQVMNHIPRRKCHLATFLCFLEIWWSVLFNMCACIRVPVKDSVSLCFGRMSLNSPHDWANTGTRLLNHVHRSRTAKAKLLIHCLQI